MHRQETIDITVPLPHGSLEPKGVLIIMAMSGYLRFTPKLFFKLLNAQSCILSIGHVLDLKTNEMDDILDT